MIKHFIKNINYFNIILAQPSYSANIVFVQYSGKFDLALPFLSFIITVSIKFRLLQLSQQTAMQSTDICRAMLQFASKFKELEHSSRLELRDFADGLPFAHMLIAAKSLDLSIDELEHNTNKWIVRVGNLKKILAKINSTLPLPSTNSDLFGDIDVVQIAKHASSEHLALFFQRVMGVLMRSSEKERFVEMIMGLDGDAQGVFVGIIRSCQGEEGQEGDSNEQVVRLQEQLRECRRDNEQLRKQMNELGKKNKNLQRELYDLRDKLANFQQEREQSRSADESINADELQLQVEQQRMLIDNLKIKLLNTVRESQIELSQLREEVASLRLKNDNLEDVEASLEQYKQLCNQSAVELQKLSDLEKDKRRLTRLLEDKDLLVRKMQDRMQAAAERTAIQEEQNITKTESDKKGKTSQKQIKFRLKSQPASQVTPRFHQSEQEQSDEVNYLQEQLNRAKSAVKQLQKQSIKARKRLQKMTRLQAEKKKLQRIVAEVNKSKDSQIQMLIVSLYELRNENVRMFQIIKQNAGRNAQKQKIK